MQCSTLTVITAVEKLTLRTNGMTQRTCNGLAVFWPTMDLAEI